MNPDELRISEQWRAWRQRVDLTEYSERFDRQAADGANVHGEADFVERLGGQRVLDAGCGTGRVAIELSGRGLHAVGVDNDADMLAVAGRKDPSTRWVLADLATVALDEEFDVIVLAGNVLNYVTPGFEPDVVDNLSRHLGPKGLLVSGASIIEDARLAPYDSWCDRARLVPVARYSSWDGQPFGPAADYAVSVHERGPHGAT